MPSAARQNRLSPGLVSFLASVAVTLVVGGVLYHVLTAGLVAADDRQAVRLARTWSDHWEHAGWLFGVKSVFAYDQTGGVYQPLAFLSLMLDARLTSDWRTAAYQFHLTNLALHIANTLIVLALVKQLSGSRTWAILLALLFALHPAQVETIASVSQRMTLLGTTFALLAIANYLQMRGGAKPYWIVPATLCFIGAILCRPVFAVLPVIFLMLDVWPLNRSGWAPLVEKLPAFLAAMAAAAVHLLNRSVARPAVDSGGVEVVSHTLASLVARLVAPVRMTPFQPIETTVAAVPLGGWFDAGICVLLAAAIAWSFVYYRALFVALAGATILLLPAAMDAVYAERLLGDHYLYPVLLVPIIAAAAWLGGKRHIFQRVWGRWSAILTGCVLPILAVQSFNLTLDWQSTLTLFQRTVALFPTWPYGHIGLVEAYIEESDLDAALLAAQEAVRVAPEHAGTQFYLGTALLLHPASRSAEAIAPLRKALASDAQWIECLQNLGVALARMGETEEAIGYFERARDLAPESASIRLGLGNAYLKVERFASARGEFQEALRQRNDAMAHLGLAIAWAANEVPEHARRHLAAAVQIDPEYALRAGRSPELLKLRSKPGFEELIRIPGENDKDVTLFPQTAPAARRARGS